MRTIWKGSISFGLVNIPINMYVATHDKEVSFTLLHKKDLSEIRYARMCKKEDVEVPWKDIVKGYEYKKGDFVVFDEKDFEKAHLKKSRTIDIINFIDEDEIDTIYYVKPYFLEPEKNGEKAYGLLRDALKKSKKVALAKFVLRNKEHLAVLKCHDNMIILNELRYNSEILSAKDFHIPATKPNPQEMNMAIKLIDQLTVPFQPKKYKDTYIDEIKAIVQQKVKGHKVFAKEEGEAAPKTKVHDIMSLLHASLEKKPKKTKKTA